MDGPELTAEDARLAEHAKAVLEGNWLGHATRPSPRLYPHQWSWDSAFTAVGYAHYHQERAQTELRSLFRGQWSDGMLPHIVFTEGTESYFPGPDFWRSERSPFAPRRPRTSAIVQPPVHATAVWALWRFAEDRERALAFLEELLPGLAAWHAYLYRERVRDEDGLVEIWHPWESGMDNSPLWDAALSRLSPPSGLAHRRRDLLEAEAAERPTDHDYACYLYLVELFAQQSHDPRQVRAATPFAVADVLFNALLVRADLDLARIAEEVGADPTPFRRWAELTAGSMNDLLWDEEVGAYLDHDLLAREAIPTPVGASFSPLFAGVPGQDRAGRMVERLQRFSAVSDDDPWVVPSFGLDEEGFLPTNYWRGPVWVNVNWILQRGLAFYGFGREADRLRRGILDLARRGGFFEHYHPGSRAGHGAERFSWSAALVLDLLFDPVWSEDQGPAAPPPAGRAGSAPAG